MMSTIRYHLTEAMFGHSEHLLAEHGDMRAFSFRYESGVAALRLTSPLGEVVLLPFQGQQIWSMQFGGRELAMRSMFSQPHPTRNYLETYGAFLIHCGFVSMGVPAEGDTHPLHGELPNAPYTGVWLDAGEDDEGVFFALGGSYQHTIAFNYNYLAQPKVVFHANSSILAAGMTVTNLKRTPMEYMYMAHVNFKPVDGGELVYSAPCTPETVRVRRSVPSHVKVGPGFREFLDELAAHPERHNVLAADLAFDPEVVFYIDYETDDAGWAHAMQRHPDGSADYISHRPDQLEKGVRWISRTPDQDCLGIVLPATAEPEGYTAEKAKGNVKLLGAGEVWHCEMQVGYLAPDATSDMTEKIKAILAA